MRGNCRNISSDVDPYALDEGLVPCQELYTPVCFFNTNAHKVTVEHVPSKNGRFELEGEYPIPGVPGMGSKIVLDFLDPGGRHRETVLNRSGQEYAPRARDRAYRGLDRGCSQSSGFLPSWGLWVEWAGAA